MALVVLLCLPHAAADEVSADTPSLSDTEDEERDNEDGEPDPELMRQDLERRPLESMNREELKEQGFVFEDTLSQQARAHATGFAALGGIVLPGAGHRQLDDSRTALALLTIDLTAMLLFGGSLALYLQPTGNPNIDERGLDLRYLGLGLISTRYLIDVFGTAYRDDLGIPDSTRRKNGWGLGLRYQYWRPRDLTLRHVATTDLAARGRHFEADARTSQELGLGMSDYEVRGRWFPFIGASPATRLGFGLSTRYHQYRLDEPYERGDLHANVHMSLNLGRFFTHLDKMIVGYSIGVGFRGYRFIDDEGWTPLEYAGWSLPMQLYLELNLTEDLRFRTSFDRSTGGWLERSPRRFLIPTFEFNYRSTERLDLHFSTSFGNGIGFGTGLRMWFGE